MGFWNIPKKKIGKLVVITPEQSIEGTAEMPI